MRVLGIAGWSGAGKTTLIERLIPALAARGLTVSTIKHAHHALALDTPGKDSFRHAEAGAAEVLLTGGTGWALLSRVADPPLAALLTRLAPVDLVLVEGFRAEAIPKLEVHRPSLGKPLLAASDPWMRGVASDAAVTGCAVPVLDLNDVAELAGFVTAAAEGV